MNKISAVILTHNSENLVADAIDSVSFCNDVIIIDNESSDRTVELAKLLRAKVFVIKSNDFSEIRNFGLKKSKSKWVLYIDDDERVSKSLANSIKEIVESTISQYSAFRIKRKNFYFGSYEWPTIEEHVRLFKKSKLHGWKGKLHETPEVEGEIGELDGYLNHFTHSNLSAMTEKTLEWSKTEAELRYKANHPKMSEWRFFRVMLTAFFDSYIRQKGYKLGTAGLIESIYQSFSIFITYARLWEMQNKNKNTSKSTH